MVFSIATNNYDTAYHRSALTVYTELHVSEGQVCELSIWKTPMSWVTPTLIHWHMHLTCVVSECFACSLTMFAVYCEPHSRWHQLHLHVCTHNYSGCLSISTCDTGCKMHVLHSTLFHGNMPYGIFSIYMYSKNQFIFTHFCCTMKCSVNGVFTPSAVYK